MAYSYVKYTGDGIEVNYSVPFLYISKTHVTVKVDGVLKTLTADYTWLTDSTIQFVVAPPDTKVVEIRRVTPKSSYAY